MDLTHPGVALDFAQTSFAVPLADASPAAVIEGFAGAYLPRLPIFIEGQSGFEVLNVLRVLDCLDERRSEFLKWKVGDGRDDRVAGYRMVTKLRPLPSAIPREVEIFRTRGWLIASIVSERLKAAMERAGCLGARCVEVT